MDGGDCKETEGHYFDYIPGVDFHYFYEPTTTPETTPSCFDCNGKNCAGSEHFVGDGFCDNKVGIPTAFLGCGSNMLM